MARPKQPPRLVQHDSGIWHVHEWNGSRTVRTSLGTADEAEAKIRFGYWLVEQDRVAPDRLSIDAILTLYWVEHVERRAADPGRVEYALAKLRPYFGHMMPADVKPVTVNRYVAERGAAAGTIRRELTVLIAALNHARKTGRLEAVPHIPQPAPPPPRDRWLSSEEVERLLATAAARRTGERMSRIERFCWIALEAPARRQSIVRLSWPQVDLKRRLIDFRTPGKVQTKKRQVAVPISDRLQPILERAWAERVSDLWVLDDHGCVKKSFQRLAAAAGFDDVTPHTLRHTAATHMAQAGVPLAMVAQILGNSIAVVERTYAHWQAEALMKAVNYIR